MVVFENANKEDLLKLLQKGYTQQEIKSYHEILRLKKQDVILILYSSGKLLLQGNKDQLKQITHEITAFNIGKKTKSEQYRPETGEIIGSDESLKGDTFGGLIVAAVKADNEIRKKLMELGVADSKTLSDKEIIPLARKIKIIAPCEIRSLFPEEYNHYQSITYLLNKLHQECASYLAPGKHIVDKYPGCTVGDIQEEKAESKYVEVAAASILAREAALEQFNALSKLAGFILPKGSTHVQEALHELKKRSLDYKKFVKINFKNVPEFF
ncbi:hypothetical protein HYX11_02135 [Candidatus Woesearchaeota archaeon]|nr:hypothetical protein [Candidatus Woesearchaeota archaeon]